MPPDFGTLRDLLSAACKEHAELTAFSCEGARISYAELDRKSDQFAAWLLQDTTLEAGDRVAIQLPNLIQYPVAALGTLKAGMVIVNINPLYTAGETEHQLQDSGARVLVTMEEILPVTSRILPGTRIEKVVLTRAAEMHPLPKRWAYKVSRAAMIRRAKAIRFSGKTKLKTVLKKGAQYLDGPGARLNNPEDSNSALALVQYTGGTTGTAKGAMLSHDNLIANLYQVDRVIDGHLPAPGSTAAAPLPFYHIYAFTLNFLYSIYRGYHGILIPDPRKSEKVIRALKPHRISCFVGISTLFSRLCKNAEFRQLDFSKLRVCTSGGMALSVATARRWENITGCRILEGYGLTETSPLVASNTFEVYEEGKISSPTRWTELKVVDDNGNELPAGEEGEIIVRGPQVMMGYWERPEETSAVLKDGWLYTGDVGVIDETGSLQVVDRIKDLIIVSGFNVYPAEIEEHVSRHPDIREAAAIGVPREEGEQVKLFVISENPELTEEEVIQFCRQGLTPYKVPSKVEFRATLPHSNVGKILRRQLRDDQAA